MKEIHDPKLLNQFLGRYQIRDLFETKGLPFILVQYGKGEILNHIRNTAGCLQFLVDGTIQIYSVREDGSSYPVCLSSEFTLLGDMEFGGETSLPFLVEARSEVTCVELPLYQYRERLANDNTFLRFMLRSIAHKMALFSQSEASFANLEEKLLYYLKYECPRQQFQGVEAAALHLRCSRRQLQRLLKSLADRQIIKKTGRGKYCLMG